MLLIPKVLANNHMDSNRMVASTKCSKMAMVSSNISSKDKAEEEASTKTEVAVAVVAVEVNTKVEEVVANITSKVVVAKWVTTRTNRDKTETNNNQCTNNKPQMVLLETSSSHKSMPTNLTASKLLKKEKTLLETASTTLSSMPSVNMKLLLSLV